MFVPKSISKEDQCQGLHPITIQTYQQWIEMKIDNKCLACGKSEPEIKLTVDHIIPLSKGGKHIRNNIQPLCFSCNVRKYTAIVDYRRGQIL